MSTVFNAAISITPPLRSDLTALAFRTICSKLARRIEDRQNNGGVSIDSLVDDVIDRLNHSLLSTIFLSITEIKLAAPADGTLNMKDEVLGVWQHALGHETRDARGEAAPNIEPPIRIRLTGRSSAEADAIMNAVMSVANDMERSDSTPGEVRKSARAAILDRINRHFYLDSALKNQFNVFGDNRRPFASGAASLDVERHDPLVMALLCVSLNKVPYLAAQLDPNLFGMIEAPDRVIQTGMISWDRFTAASDANAERNLEELMASIRTRLLKRFIP